ncbi:hypothetical protein Q0M94_06705 [Deinococcus radiomollis]|uniref:hypothetical protein n=1 Tax=Deinococcus radiomollis TaxID=468916 RepID=UPI003892B6E9
MTGHTSDEMIGTDGTGHERGTDAESATKTPDMRGGVVQDSPGTSNVNVEHDNGGNGNLTGEERPIKDDTDDL